MYHHVVHVLIMRRGRMNGQYGSSVYFHGRLIDPLGHAIVFRRAHITLHITRIRSMSLYLYPITSAALLQPDDN